MAAKPSKPPETKTINNQQNNDNLLNNIDNNLYKCLEKKGTDCCCTNISIMQLFHEMKQEFPTVPDQVVNQCVIDNCHDRENCIDDLKKELLLHPNTVYPSNVLRNQQQQQNQINFLCNKKPLIPTRPAPIPKINCDSKSVQFNNNNINNNINNNKSNNISNNKNIEVSNIISNNNCLITLNSSDMRPEKSDNISEINNRTNLPPQRPTTLNFREQQQQPQSQFVQSSQQNNQRLISSSTGAINRPVRTAPLPPSSSSSTSSLGQNSTYLSSHTNPSLTPLGYSSFPSTKQQMPPNVQICDQNFSGGTTTTLIQSPISVSDSGESEISVNISLSPSSDRSRGLPPTPTKTTHPTRRISSISVQPEPPYTRDFTSQSPRSFTSLSLTLRTPSTTPQSPIDITAGQGLTYSSSSFDARRGYGKKLNITVTEGGGTISASQMRPRSWYNTPIQNSDNEFDIGTEQMNVLRIGSSMPNVAQNQIEPIFKETIVSSPTDLEVQKSDVIKRQKIRKQQLARGLESNKQILQKMQNEVKILLSPIPPGETTRLDNEIERLRCDCEKIWNEIEKARASGVALTDDFYENIYTCQRLPIQQPRTRQRPPRPPPPRLSQIQQQQQSIPHQNPIISPSTLDQQYQEMNSSINQTNYNNENDNYSNPNNDDGGPPWTCNMCTFRNHPLLNKCEFCDNVRIIPGTIRIVSSNDCSNSNNNTSQVPNALPINPKQITNPT